MDTLIIIFLLAALACFIIAFVGSWTPKANLVALGLALWVATELLPHLS